MDIAPYNSRFSTNEDSHDGLASNRFVAYVSERPQLMIEFFRSDFHIYTAGSLSFGQILLNARIAIAEAADNLFFDPFGPPRRRLRLYDIYSQSLMICASREGEITTWPLDTWLASIDWSGFRELTSPAAIDLPITPSYVRVAIPSIGVTHWADTEEALRDEKSNARSGFAFARMDRDYYFSKRWFYWFRRIADLLLRTLPTDSLTDEDLGEVINFVSSQLEERYV